MSAYASHEREPEARGSSPFRSQLRLAAPESSVRSARACQPVVPTIPDEVAGSVIDQLLDRVAERIAAFVVARLDIDDRGNSEWFDSLHAAEYLGVHRDTLRKLAAERAIPSEQDGPGCKLYFRRADLDAWRRSGGRPRHLSMSVADAA
jgi:excisionase family DNA binding protein